MGRGIGFCWINEVMGEGIFNGRTVSCVKDCELFIALHSSDG